MVVGIETSFFGTEPSLTSPLIETLHLNMCVNVLKRKADANSESATDSWEQGTTNWGKPFQPTFT